MFHNLKLRTSILLGYSAPITLFIITAFLVSTNINEAEEASQLANTSRAISNQANQLEMAINGTIRGSRGYLLTRSLSNKNTVTNSNDEFSSALEKLTLWVKDPEQKARLNQLNNLQKDLNDLAIEAINIVDKGNNQDSLNLTKMDKDTQAWDTFKSVMDDFSIKQQNILDERQALQKELLQRLSLIVWITSLGAAVIAILVGIWVTSRISAILNNSVNTLASSSAEISATAEQHERTVLQQTSSVSQTSATTEELRVSAQTSSDQAENAAAVVKKARQLAEEGSVSSEQSTASMGDLQNNVRAVAEQILQLSEQAGQIGVIARVVGDLASETNMLALNAAVEAARAGENGKGFAVVASEVRKLADQSKKSAERANALVADIQKATNSAVMVAEEGSKTAQEVFNISVQNGRTFQSLTDYAEMIDQNASQVVLNSRQQAEALAQISDSMKGLNASATEMAAGTKQTKIGLVNLTDVAKSLKAMI